MKLRVSTICAVALSIGGVWCQSSPSASEKPKSFYGAAITVSTVTPTEQNAFVPSGTYEEDPACKGLIGKACGGPKQPECKWVEWTYIAASGTTVKGCYCADTSRGPVKEGKNTLPHPRCVGSVK